MTAPKEELPDEVRESSDLDGILRHLSRALPDALIRALLPGARFVGWEDTQLASRQRRMDRCLLVQRGAERIRVHLEWQTEWNADVPLRVFEYQVLDVLAFLEAEPDRAGSEDASHAANHSFQQVRIESHVVLLTGRDEPWPEQMEVRISPDSTPFSGVRFQVHAVYQRTVSELMARGPLFAIFAPLATDATADQVPAWLRYLRSTRSKRRYAELASAMSVMARVDRRQRQLEQVILGLLPEDVTMKSAIYDLGLEHGRKKEREATRLALEESRLALEEARWAVRNICELLGIKLTSARLDRLEGLDRDALDRLRRHLMQQRAWPKT